MPENPNRHVPITSLEEDIVLQESLRFAVPLWIEELRRMPDHLREGCILRWGLDGGRQVGHRGDALQFRPKSWRPTAIAFNALAKGLAAAAFHPDGANFPGLHWCVKPHGGCPWRGAT